MRDKILLLVDLSYQSYRATSSHLDLTSADGTFTGGVYGFLVSLARTILDCEASHVVVCQDIKPYVRSKEYPDYKMLRRNVKKDARAEEIREKHLLSVPLICAAMEEVGIPLLGVAGFESDDCIANTGKPRACFHSAKARLLDGKGPLQAITPATCSGLRSPTH